MFFLEIIFRMYKNNTEYDIIVMLEIVTLALFLSTIMFAL